MIGKLSALDGPPAGAAVVQAIHPESDKARADRLEREVLSLKARVAPLQNDRNAAEARAHHAEQDLGRLHEQLATTTAQRDQHQRDLARAQATAHTEHAAHELAQAEASVLRAALQDLAEHGTRADMNPTIGPPTTDSTSALSSWYSRYLRRVDQVVRDMAAGALSGHAGRQLLDRMRDLEQDKRIAAQNLADAEAQLSQWLGTMGAYGACGQCSKEGPLWQRPDHTAASWSCWCHACWMAEAQQQVELVRQMNHALERERTALVQDAAALQIEAGEERAAYAALIEEYGSLDVVLGLLEEDEDEPVYVPGPKLIDLLQQQGLQLSPCRCAHDLHQTATPGLRECPVHGDSGGPTDPRQDLLAAHSLHRLLLGPDGKCRACGQSRFNHRDCDLGAAIAWLQEQAQQPAVPAERIPS